MSKNRSIHQPSQLKLPFPSNITDPHHLGANGNIICLSRALEKKNRSTIEKRRKDIAQKIIAYANDLGW